MLPIISNVKTGTPIFSKYEDDLSKRDCVDGFVHGLAGQLDDLQEAELGGDLSEVERLSQNLVNGASRSGYPLLVGVGEAAITACRAGKDDEVRKTIEDLTDLTMRVRRGSRGAA